MLINIALKQTAGLYTLSEFAINDFQPDMSEPREVTKYLLRGPGVPFRIP